MVKINVTFLNIEKYKKMHNLSETESIINISNLLLFFSSETCCCYIFERLLICLL